MATEKNITGGKQAGALAGAAQIEQLADSLSKAADVMHAQLMRAIKQRSNGAGIGETDAMALFDQEVALRQQAMALHLDAAKYAIRDLPEAQQSVLEAVQQAMETMARIARVQDLIGIGAGLLGLAGAVIAGDVGDAFEALKKLRADISHYHAGQV